MKRCFKCGTTKPRTEFYAHSMMGDGLLGKCKECTKADARAVRLAKIEHYRSYDRMRASVPHRVQARKQYGRTEAGRIASLKAKQRWLELNQERRRAQVSLNNALRDGRIQRHPCFVCGETGAEAHHPDYDAPLDVVWLCDAHHKQVHKEARQYEREAA